MKSAGTLFELIQRLDEVEDSDPSHPLVIYAQNGADAGRNSPALICPRSEGGVWSAWRGGITPSPEDRFRTVIFFSGHGAYFPLESDREGM